MSLIPVLGDAVADEPAAEEPADEQSEVPADA
jgi:hypothetical protein